jgi:carboxypeptidase Q
MSSVIMPMFSQPVDADRLCAMHRALAILLFCIACARPGNSLRQPSAEPPSAYALASALARDVGPRLAGSEGDARAVAWAERTMTSMGLSIVRREPVPVPVWRRKTERAEMDENGTKTPLAITALGWSNGTGPEGITAEVAAFDSLDALIAASPGEVEGKIAFCNVPMERTPNGAGYGKTVGVRARCASEAEKKGAVAAVIRSVGTDESDFPHTGSMKMDGSKIPAGALSTLAAKRLAEAALRGRTKLNVVLETERGEPKASANVIGVVRATTRPDEIVLVGAHLDAWDLGQGAVDDGAGVGIALAVAGRFVRRPGERTLRVVLFAAEENSLAGGKAYAEAHASDRHVAAMELDSGTGRPVEVRVRAGKPVTLPIIPGVPTSTQPADGGADISPLRARGVPMLDVRQDLSEYFDIHHTAADRVEALRAPELEQVTRAAEAVLRYATGNVDFGVVPR